MIRDKISKYFTDRGFHPVEMGLSCMDLFYIERDRAASVIWVIDTAGENCPDAEALLWDNADRMLDDEDFLYR